MERRRYPIGIQTFANIVRDGYIYVDKTDLVWELQNYAKYVFLSRPRRFGKSLLSTTLTSYFRGEKELFEGLKIMQLEKEWKKYPVIHLDLSLAKGQETPEDLRYRLCLMLESYKKMFGNVAAEKSPGSILEGLIKRASEQTGEPVAIIIDEYDSPLLEVMHESEMLDKLRKVMQEFYAPLKACEGYIKFCFITGITKFSQLSIFSTINNLLNVTMEPKFAAICGITEEELTTVMAKDIKQLAEVYEVTPEEMQQKLKLHYDGYHFSENSLGVYNPFSLMKAFRHMKIGGYWFESGTPTYLIRQLQRFGTDITTLDHLEVPASAFDQPTENMENVLPLLYQSGYLTIKDYEREGEIYTLSFPNQEVKIGYTQGLLPAYTGLYSADVQTGFALKFWRALKKHDTDLALREMQAYLAGIPYVEGFKKKLENAATAEGFYEYTFYLIFSMLNVYTRTQVKCSQGRTDMVVFMSDTIYVFEMKVNGTAQEAISQINSRGYAVPYQTDGRQVVKVGVSFDTDLRTIGEWLIEA